MAVMPCKDCQKRFVGCHSSCTEYLSFREEKTAENQRRQDEFLLERALRGITHRDGRKRSF